MGKQQKKGDKSAFDIILTVLSLISGVATIVQIFNYFTRTISFYTLMRFVAILFLCLLITRIQIAVIKDVRPQTGIGTTIYGKHILALDIFLVFLALSLYASNFFLKPVTSGTLSKDKLHEWVEQDDLNQKITEVSIKNTVKNAIPSAKDLSEEGNGSVLGWRKGTTLYLAGHKGIAAPQDCAFLFSSREANDNEKQRWSKLKRVTGGENLKTNNTQTMKCMFYYCTALESIDVSEWDTLLVTDMCAMFYGCEKLEKIIVDDWDTASVMNMAWMFYNCGSLTSLNVDKFNTQNVVSMHHMFYGCKKLESLDVSSWDTSQVGIIPEEKTNEKNYYGGMSYMFYGCESLTSLGEKGVDEWVLADNVSTFDMFDKTKWEKNPPIQSPGTLSKEKLTEWAVEDVTRRNSIEKVIFIDDLQQAPEYAMDFSEKQNRGILAWLDAGTLCIAGKKRIMAPTDCSYLFSDKNAENDSYAKWNSLLSIENAHVLDTSNVENMEGMFYYCTKLETVDVSEWDTQNVKNMGLMFSHCESLEEIDISRFLTANVKSVNYMFNECHRLLSLGEKNVGSWDTSSVNDMRGMFYECEKLTDLEVGSWDTSNVEYMMWLFYGCESLTSLDVAGFNTKNVINMRSMFNKCRHLESLNVSDWDTSKVTDMGWMFYYCESLTSLNVEGFDTGNVTALNSMFEGCKNLESLEVDNWNTSNVETMGWMFYGCESLTSLNVSRFDTGNVFNMYAMFYGCKKLESLDISSWDTSQVGIIPEDKKNDDIYYGGVSYMLFGCESLNSLGEKDVSEWTLSENVSAYKMFEGTRWEKEPLISSPSTLSKQKLREWTTGEVKRRSSIEKVVFLDNKQGAPDNAMDFSEEQNQGILAWLDTGILYIASSDRIMAPKDCSYLFSDEEAGNDNYAKWNSLISIENAHLLDTSNVESMEFMFYYCTKLETLDVSEWDTRNVKDMSYMFYHCESIEELETSQFLTANVTSVSNMFSECYRLISLGEKNVSEWDTSSVNDMTSMFYDCKNLKSLDVSNWDTSNVENMAWMFDGCESLISLDVSMFNTGHVFNMYAMFYGCKNIVSLDVSTWDTSHVGVIPEGLSDDTNYTGGMGFMFAECTSLTDLGEKGVSEWRLSDNVNTYAMFQGTIWAEDPPINNMES